MTKTKKIFAGAAGLAALAASLGCASMMSDQEAAQKAGEVMRASFNTRGIATVDRLNQDDVQKACTEARGQPLPPALFEKLQAAQLATVQKPASGKLVGDWKAGEKLAQEGRGMQWSDAADGPKGGNCYACHQLAPQEISFGNIGPSLYKFGALRGQSKEIVEYTYNKIYNAQAYNVCSNMPRFGHQKILTPEQVADLVALLVDPASPVNQ